jgi:membrane protein YdbS with pleckstrin-like domain
MSPELRSAIYTAIPPIGALLVVFGVVSEEQWAVMAAAIVAILGVVVAFFHRPTSGPI